MKYYQEINLLPDTDINLGVIWQHLFQQVHIALVENKARDNQSLIAVGFPDYGKERFPLGAKLRLFSNDRSRLEKLGIERWLSRLEDYVHVKGIKDVPNHVTYVSFTRKHVKSPERIERDMKQKAALWASKSGNSMETCFRELEKSKPLAHSTLPYIYLFSQQTKRRSANDRSKFPLFIEMHTTTSSQEGAFDCYGLSSKVNAKNCLATVPIF